MDFLKKIKSIKKNEELKAKAHSFISDIGEKLMEGEEFVKEKFNNANESFIKTYNEQFGKNIFTVIFNTVEKEILESNLNERNTLEISLDENKDINIATLIKKSAPKSVDVSRFLKSDEYKDLLFRAIYIHFSNEEQLEVSLNKLDNIISIKLIDNNSEDVVEEEISYESKEDN